MLCYITPVNTSKKIFDFHTSWPVGIALTALHKISHAWMWNSWCYCCCIYPKMNKRKYVYSEFIFGSETGKQGICSSLCVWTRSSEKGLKYLSAQISNSTRIWFPERKDFGLYSSRWLLSTRILFTMYFVFFPVNLIVKIQIYRNVVTDCIL